MMSDTQNAINESLTPRSENMSTETKEIIIKGNPIAKYNEGTQAIGERDFSFDIL